MFDFGGPLAENSPAGRQGRRQTLFYEKIVLFIGFWKQVRLGQKRRRWELLP